MKDSRLLWQAIAKILLMLLIFKSASACAETVQELNTWNYRKEWDTLSNLSYSLARSPLPKRGLYDNLRVEIICKDNKLQFAVDANSLITSQGRDFELEYQVDKNIPVVIQMRTYSDTKRRGYTDEHVERIAKDLLSGHSIFIRIHTLIRTVLSGALSLDDASQPIHKVLADCGVQSTGKAESQPDYSLAEFERDFKKLSPEQQRQVLGVLKEILEGIR